MVQRPAQNWWRDLRRTLGWHRRLVAAGLAAVAVVVGLQAARPAPPPTTAVLTAARDLAAGAVITAEDVVTADLPTAAVPAGALPPGSDVVGRTVAGPVRAGETITDVRLVGPGLVAGLGAGLVAAPVRVADAGAAALVRPGDRVDVLATPADAETAGDPTRVVAADVVVAAVVDAGGAAAVDGALLLVATTPTVASALADATITDRLSLTLRAESISLRSG